MRIETKYNLGDTVWVIEQDKPESPWAVLGEREIMYIDISVGNDRGVEIAYVVYGMSIKFEKNCFATLEDAQAECDRRNREMEQDK